MSDNVYPTAFCFTPSIQSDLPPEVAHRYSLDGTIKSRKDFRCSENCDFQLSLVNFGKTITDKMQAPHYRAGKLDQIHNPIYCNLMQEHFRARELEETVEDSHAFQRDKSKITVHIDLVNATLADIPSSRSTNNKYVDNTTPLLSRKNRSISSESLKSISQHIRSLKRLVTYFRDAKHGELYTFTNENNIPIDLDNHFINLDKKPLLTEYRPHVYYGKATVQKREKTDESSFYLIRLSTSCQLNNVNVQPTFLVNADKEEHKENGKIIRGTVSQLKILEKASTSKEEITLYFLGSFKLYNSTYINPAIEHSRLLKYLVFSKE